MKGPFLRTAQSTERLMLQVLAALCLPFAAAIWIDGASAAVAIATTLASAVATEVVILRRAPADLSAVVTGAIVVLLLPRESPWWLGLLAGALAIGLGKHAFGGLGKNPFNPAALSRAVLMGVLPGQFIAPTWELDAVTMATPLSKGLSSATPVLETILWGDVPGCIGQVAPWAVIAGGLLLVVMRTVDWRVPLTYLAAICLLALVLPAGDRLLGHAPWLVGNPLLHLLAGGTLVAAFFMLTDPVTAPFSPGGRIVFAALAAVVTMVARYYTPYPDGAVLAVLAANAAVPIIDRVALAGRIAS